MNLDYANDFSDDTPPPMKRSGIGGGWGVVFAVIFLMFFGCAKQTPPSIMADSTVTAKTFQQLEGKHARTLNGPADILGDTTKNARKPVMVKER
jgi:hypothetical protein